MRAANLPLIGFAALVVAADACWGQGLFALLLVLVAAATTRLARPAVRWARSVHAVAHPGGRSKHEGVTPLAGGVALAAPIFAVLLGMAVATDSRVFGILAGGMLLFVVGAADDIRRVRPRYKLLAQALAGLFLVLAGYRLPVLSIPGVGTLALGAFEMPVLIGWIVLATNALNVSDGLDGLATGLCALGTIFLALAGVPIAMPLLVLAACAGLLHHNLPRATLFLGDAGSLLLGFLLASMALQVPVASNVPVALALFAYPLGDLLLAVVRRLIRGSPIFAADCGHVHHRLVRHLGSPGAALAVLLGFAVVQLATALLWPGVLSLALGAALWTCMVFVLARASTYSLAQVISERAINKRLHVLCSYATAKIRMAQDRLHVWRALGVLTGGMGLRSLALDGVDVPPREVRRAYDASLRGSATDDATGLAHILPLLDGTCTWVDSNAACSRALRQERENVVCRLVRRAQERIRTMTRDRLVAQPVHSPAHGPEAVCRPLRPRSRRTRAA